MAWEWSHTTDAYENARANVAELPRQTLLTILREWAYHDREQAGKIRRVFTPAGKPAGFTLPPGIRRLATETLADLVWDRMEQHQTCTTGGHKAYACPDGCHTVPFDREADDSE